MDDPIYNILLLLNHLISYVHLGNILIFHFLLIVHSGTDSFFYILGIIAFFTAFGMMLSQMGSEAALMINFFAILNEIIMRMVIMTQFIIFCCC
jgi:hypothetical protein